ncbi:YdcF family protein [Microbacteriaceae bacterium VKM Ac-2854]|nr:YdcF family protein [Microbacteriaceae bacterium VKM Ac-2854]
MAERVRGRSRLRIVLLALVVVAVQVALAVLPWRLYGDPAIDVVTKTDAVVVIGPSHSWRVEAARTVVAEGLTDNVIIPLSGGRWSDSSACETGMAGATVYCYVPDPFTTLGEAQYVWRLAKEKGWSNVTVITMKEHISRTRFVFEKCFQGRLAVRATGVLEASNLRKLLDEATYQTGAFMKALVVAPDCP